MRLLAQPLFTDSPHPLSKSYQSNDLPFPLLIPASPPYIRWRRCRCQIFLHWSLRLHSCRPAILPHWWAIHGTYHQCTRCPGIHRSNIYKRSPSQSGRCRWIQSSDGAGRRGDKKGHGHAGRFCPQRWRGGERQDDDTSMASVRPRLTRGGAVLAEHRWLKRFIRCPMVIAGC